jgi:hypothetical protein
MSQEIPRYLSNLMVHLPYQNGSRCIVYLVSTNVPTPSSEEPPLVLARSNQNQVNNLALRLGSEVFQVVEPVTLSPTRATGAVHIVLMTYKPEYTEGAQKMYTHFKKGKNCIKIVILNIYR